LFITDEIEFMRYEFMGISGKYYMPKINIDKFFTSNGIVTAFTSKEVKYEKNVTNTKYCLGGKEFTDFITKDVKENNSFNLHLSLMFDEVRNGVCSDTKIHDSTNIIFCDLNAMEGNFCFGKAPILSFAGKIVP